MFQREELAGRTAFVLAVLMVASGLGRGRLSLNTSSEARKYQGQS